MNESQKDIKAVFQKLQIQENNSDCQEYTTALEVELANKSQLQYIIIFCVIIKIIGT